MRTKKTEAQHTRQFFCQPCNSESMTLEEMKAHMKEKHGITNFKGSRRGMQFLDGADFYSNTLEWEFTCEAGSVKVTELSEGPRA